MALAHTSFNYFVMLVHELVLLQLLVTTRRPFLSTTWLKRPQRMRQTHPLMEAKPLLSPLRSRLPKMSFSCNCLCFFFMISSQFYLLLKLRTALLGNAIELPMLLF